MSRKVMEEVSDKTRDVTNSSRSEVQTGFKPAAGRDDSPEAQRVLQELEKENEDLSQRSRQLQRKLARYVCKAAEANAKLRRSPDLPRDRYEYEVCIRTLSALKQQVTADSESAHLQAEELSSQLQEKLEKVETEQQELEALWRSAVAALSPHLGEEAARARVEASLRAEKLAQDSLSQVRLKHFKLTLRIRRLEAELREEEEEEFNREVLEVKNQQLEAERRQKELSERKAAEIKQLINENIRVSQVLPKVKEKLCQIQVEVKNKRQQLAEVEAVVMEKKDLLTRTKQACHRLQRDNLRLQERRGLLGNRVLLQDFEDTVDAAEQLENRLETLELQHADMISCCYKLRNLME
ncbi:coiled-coil domain-containing protein 96 isoform X1 [Oryzias latipes]|uniref:CCDC113/CCDC96 coiled-coil domain-containing protein n=1 Tax=Oryzias latipes TaxID=8090 RepID=A0A3B3I215_ORYLA|nr:coiled-coil domain-containing protein 96 isoform X1 [Oryzias latipes]